MTKSLDNESVRQAAIDWFVRLQGEASLADWMDFRTWLEADRAHAEAYDAVETIWVEVESPSVAPPAEARPATGVVVPFRARIDRRSLWLGAAAAAAVAAAVVTSQLTAPPPAVLYTTGPGQTRVVTLAEGSRLTLGAGTRIEVRLSPARRDVELAEGEASFDVTHRLDRPFIVTVGARQVRVLGTEFNIFHRAGDLVVTVRRGLVSVAEHDRDQGVRLSPGQQLVARDGSRSAQVSTVDPQVAFARTQGKLVYLEAPLPQVVADLNSYVSIPIRVDPSASAIKVSGVLRIETEEAMLERLVLFAPITTHAVGGEIVLRAKAAAP